MSFFEDLPPEPWDPPPPGPPALQASDGQPYGVVPGVVALELLLAHTDRLAVYLPELLVYPAVVVLRLQLLGVRPPRPGIASGPGTWRFGVQFSAVLRQICAMLRVVARPVSGGASSKKLTRFAV